MGRDQTCLAPHTHTHEPRFDLNKKLPPISKANNICSYNKSNFNSTLTGLGHGGETFLCTSEPFLRKYKRVLYTWQTNGECNLIRRLVGFHFFPFEINSGVNSNVIRVLQWNSFRKWMDARQTVLLLIMDTIASDDCHFSPMSFIQFDFKIHSFFQGEQQKSTFEILISPNENNRNLSTHEQRTS